MGASIFGKLIIYDRSKFRGLTHATYHELAVYTARSGLGLGFRPSHGASFFVGPRGVVQFFHCLPVLGPLGGGVVSRVAIYLHLV